MTPRLELNPRYRAQKLLCPQYRYMLSFQREERRRPPPPALSHWEDRKRERKGHLGSLTRTLSVGFSPGITLPSDRNDCYLEVSRASGNILSSGEILKLMFNNKHKLDKSEAWRPKLVLAVTVIDSIFKYIFCFAVIAVPCVSRHNPVVILRWDSFCSAH